MKQTAWRTIAVLSLILFSVTIATSMLVNYSLNSRLDELTAEFSQLNFRVNYLDKVATCQFHEQDAYNFNVPSNWGESIGLPYIPVGSAIQIRFLILSGNASAGKLLLFVTPFRNPNATNYAFDQYGNLIPLPTTIVQIPLSTNGTANFVVPYQGNYGLQINNSGSSTLIVEVWVNAPPYC